MSYLSCWQNFGIFDAKISTINIIISLDLSNFDISSIENMNNMFYDCNDYLVYCAKNNSKTTKLINHIHDSPYIFKYNNNCSDICFDPYKK